MDIKELQYLAGITNRPKWTTYEGSNISITGQEKADLQRKTILNPALMSGLNCGFQDHTLLEKCQ